MHRERRVPTGRHEHPEVVGEPVDEVVEQFEGRSGSGKVSVVDDQDEVIAEFFDRDDESGGERPSQ